MASLLTKAGSTPPDFTLISDSLSNPGTLVLRHLIAKAAQRSCRVIIISFDASAESVFALCRGVFPDAGPVLVDCYSPVSTPHPAFAQHVAGCSEFAALGAQLHELAAPDTLFVVFSLSTLFLTHASTVMYFVQATLPST